MTMGPRRDDRSTLCQFVRIGSAGTRNAASRRRRGAACAHPRVPAHERRSLASPDFIGDVLQRAIRRRNHHFYDAHSGVWARARLVLTKNRERGEATPPGYRRLCVQLCVAVPQMAHARAVRRRRSRSVSTLADGLSHRVQSSGRGRPLAAAGGPRVSSDQPSTDEIDQPFGEAVPRRPHSVQHARAQQARTPPVAVAVPLRGWRTSPGGLRKMQDHLLAVARRRVVALLRSFRRSPRSVSLYALFAKAATVVIISRSSCWLPGGTYDIVDGRSLGSRRGAKRLQPGVSLRPRAHALERQCRNEGGDRRAQHHLRARTRSAASCVSICCRSHSRSARSCSCWSRSVRSSSSRC